MFLRGRVTRYLYPPSSSIDTQNDNLLITLNIPIPFTVFTLPRKYLQIRLSPSTKYLRFIYYLFSKTHVKKYILLENDIMILKPFCIDLSVKYICITYNIIVYYTLFSILLILYYIKYKFEKITNIIYVYFILFIIKRKRLGF